MPIYWHDTENNEIPQSLFAPLKWDDEMSLVKELRDKLGELVNRKDKDALPKSLLGKIATYADMQTRQTNTKDKGRWAWMMAYDLSRFRDTVRDTDTKAFLNLIISFLKNTIAS